MLKVKLDYTNKISLEEGKENDNSDYVLTAQNGGQVVEIGLSRYELRDLLKMIFQVGKVSIQKNVMWNKMYIKELKK